MKRWQLYVAWTVMPLFVIGYPFLWPWVRFRDVIRPWTWKVRNQERRPDA